MQQRNENTRNSKLPAPPQSHCVSGNTVFSNKGNRIARYACALATTALLFVQGEARACGNDNVGTYIPTTDPNTWQYSSSFFSNAITTAVPQSTDVGVTTYIPPGGGGGGGQPNAADVDAAAKGLPVGGRISIQVPCMPEVIVTATPVAGYGPSASRFLRVIRGAAGSRFASTSTATVERGTARCDSDQSVKDAAACNAIHRVKPF